MGNNIAIVAGIIPALTAASIVLRRVAGLGTASTLPATARNEDEGGDA